MTAETSFVDETAAEMLKTLQSWWEIPSMAQYISLFREPFNLPEIEIEELEKGFIDDTIRGPSTWLQKLIFAFLRSIMPGRINSENWEEQLRKLVRRKLAVGESNPFEEDKSFHELKIRNKVDIVYSLCLHRLDRSDIAELMKSMDADALGVQKLGNDDEGNTYWYFYGSRLYKEENTEQKKSWDEEWKDTKKKTLRKRGRGRPRKRVPPSDGESDLDDSDSKKNDGYMNVSEKSRWSVVCDTIEEWVNLAEKFKTSKSKNELSLFKIIQENFLPHLNKIYEEKEKKLQQKIKELMPLPKREKIVTRREGRRQRGEVIEEPSIINGHYNDEAYKMHIAKDRAHRLEQRNKRASEVDCIQVPARSKKIKDYNADNSFEQEHEDNLSLSILSQSESSDIDWPSQMKKLLSSIKLHKDAWPFLYPVNEDDAPGYYEIIQEPIDLSTIESRLYQGQYDSLQDLDDDFCKMVSNCKLYNGDYHPYSKMVKALKRMFRDGVAKILESIKLSQEPEGSSDSQYNSSSNSASSPSEPRALSPSSRKKSKDRKKRKRKMEALEMLAEATDLAVQDNFVNRTSPQQKKSPVPQQVQAVPQHVPSSSLPLIDVTTTSSSINKTALPITSSNFVPMNNNIPKPKKDKPMVIRAKLAELEKRKSPVENAAPTSLNVVSSTNTINSIPQNNVNNVYQPASAKTVPVVYSGYNPTSAPGQNDLRFKNNPPTTVTMQSNVCMPNGMPVMQQVLIPAAPQQIQVPANGQIVFAQPQNTVRLFNKEQNMQILNNVGQVRQMSQGYGKVLPQFIAPGQVMQVSKDAMSNLQYQNVSENNTQTFAQVAQNPQQFVNIPTYMITNQNAVNDPSQQSMMNLQPYQLPQRQMQINGQGN